MTADNNMPTKMIKGYKDFISTAGERLTSKPTPILVGVTLKVRTLSGDYIAIGDEEEQPFRLTTEGQAFVIDFVNDLSKVVVVAESGTANCIEWFGG